MLVLDTSAVIEVLHNSACGKDILAVIKDESICITSLTVHELLVGLEVDFSDSLAISDTLAFGPAEAFMSARISAALRKIGKPINQIDLFIAGICIEHNLTLVTTDSDFSQIKGLKVKLFSA